MKIDVYVRAEYRAKLSQQEFDCIRKRQLSYAKGYPFARASFAWIIQREFLRWEPLPPVRAPPRVRERQLVLVRRRP